MRILFLTDNYPPEVNAPARRTSEHCKAWAASGNHVTVVTCWPNFPAGVVYDGYRNKIYGRSTLDGVTVKRVWTYISRNEGFLRRTLDYVSFAVSAFVVGLFTKSDVIVATSPQFFTTIAARALSFVKRVPWVFELRDIWPESIHAVGALEKGKIYRFLEFLELSLYRSASIVIAVTPAFKQNLIDRGISSDKIKVVPNGVDANLFAEHEKDAGLLDELGLNGKFVAGYIGTHGMAHALDMVVRAAAKTDAAKFAFLFVGDGAEKKSVQRLTHELGVTNIVFHDSIGSDEIHRYISVVDVAIVPLRNSETFRSVIPSKIFESSAMAKPILLGVDGQAREIVEDYGAGTFFEPENESEFLEALRQLAEDSAHYRACQDGCRRLAKDFDRRKLAACALENISLVAVRP